MFTGLVEARVPVRTLEPRGAGARLVVASPGAGFEVAAGDSIAVSGCCLTVAEPPAGPGAELAFDLSSETLERTWLGDLEPGRTVNLERALRLGDRLGGHMVSGHVDGLARVVSIEGDRQGGWEFRFEVAEGLERFLVDKGSVTLDGISLTVVEPRGRVFRVAVIPVTFDETSLGLAEPGQAVNLEADLVAKWIERFVRPDA
jgi:riboflavin synthase